MDIFEFELRYLSFKGLSSRYELGFSQEMILELVKRTNKGNLEKKLTDTTPDELKKLTQDTYTDYKAKFIQDSQSTMVGDFSLAEYTNRLEYELKVTKEMGYNTYFLIVQDYINRAKTHDISVGPGRGSAAGSLMAFLIGITDIDPLLYDLIFERFLNPARISMPDIDTDFEDIKRDKILEYVKNKYGNDKVSLIGTYMTMAAKAAFKDVARSFGMPFEQSNRISNLITDKDIKSSLQTNDEFKAVVEGDPMVGKITEIAIALEGTIRQTGVHACGVIISPEVVTEFSPVQYPPKGGGKEGKDEERIVSQYDGHFLEDIGLLKMDFLGLRNLSIIKNTIKIYVARAKRHGWEIPRLFQVFMETTGFYPDLKDSKTYEAIFQTGDTNGVFQFESDGMKAWLKKLKPSNIDDIIAMVALYRPGPMEFIPYYIDRKSGKEELNYMIGEIYETLEQKYGKETADLEKQKLTEDLSPFMNVTYGIPIYQEQLMRIVQAMAGFSLGEADMLRRGVGKKIKEVIEKIKAEFIEKASNFKDYKPETSIYVYEKMIEPAANYSFNKSHAACYAIIAYQTAYLKAHYPIEFNAALLGSVEEDTDKLAKFIDELKMQGFKVLPPHINESYRHVAAIHDTIRIGFVAIKGIGYEVARFIEEEREKAGKFKDIEDFLKRCTSVVNKKSLESLAKSGAFDGMIDRNSVLYNINEIIEFSKGASGSNGGQSVGLFDFGEISTRLELKKTFQTPTLEKLMMEFETFKTFISAHPFDGLYKYIKSKYNFISMFKDVEDYGDIKFVGFIKEIRRIQKKGFFVTIEDISGEIDIFLKNILDLKKFDICIFKGSKGKHNCRIKEIVKTSVPGLYDKAIKSGKYDETDVVMEVRSKRLKTNEKNNIDTSIYSEKKEDSLPKEIGNIDNNEIDETDESIDTISAENDESLIDNNDEIINQDETISQDSDNL